MNAHLASGKSNIGIDFIPTVEQETKRSWWKLVGNGTLIFNSLLKLTKVRPLFTLLHRGSDNYPILIVLSANYIHQSNRDFYANEGISEALTFWPFVLSRLHARRRHLQKYCTVFEIRYLIGWDHEAIYKLQSSYKVHLNTISNGELSDSLCDNVNRQVWI